MTNENVTALIPAHNEEANIEQTIRSLKEQTVVPGRILVACDNCTDRTSDISKDLGCEVLVTVDNTYMKAGALNQAIPMVTTEYVLVMDADTSLVPHWIETALERLPQRGTVGAVGAVFVGDPHNLLERCQANEWLRYRRQLSQTGRVWVLSGTAALIRTKALHDVAEAREDGSLPGDGFYMTSAKTEDFELTLALRSVGWEIQSPVSCESVTELMPTVGDLWKQRLRWYGGALETLRAYGFKKVSIRYLWQQFMLAVSVLAMMLLGLMTVAQSYYGVFSFQPFWMLIGAVFWLERVVTVKGVKARLWAALLIPELVYAIFLQICWVWAFARFCSGKTIVWTHLGEV